MSISTVPGKACFQQLHRTGATGIFQRGGTLRDGVLVEKFAGHSGRSCACIRQCRTQACDGSRTGAHRECSWHHRSHEQGNAEARQPAQGQLWQCENCYDCSLPGSLIETQHALHFCLSLSTSTLRNGLSQYCLHACQVTCPEAPVTHLV